MCMCNYIDFHSIGSLLEHMMTQFSDAYMRYQASIRWGTGIPGVASKSERICWNKQFTEMTMSLLL